MLSGQSKRGGKRQEERGENAKPVRPCLSVPPSKSACPPPPPSLPAQSLSSSPVLSQNKTKTKPQMQEPNTWHGRVGEKGMVYRSEGYRVEKNVI